MECFNELLLKLREVHERELEGWQVKVQELSNKKGCDTKRMEELFTRNQQMKEQQRLLTENIKTLENRLRAGLCDRCTVTQEVAKRRQQEYEASQIQSLQHISLLATEMNNLKKENRRLRDEIRNLRAAYESHSDHCSNSSTTTEVKAHSSPDRPPSSGPMGLISTAGSRASSQPADSDAAVKTEAEVRSEEPESRQLRGMNRCHFEPYKPLLMPTVLAPWKTDNSVNRAGERRAPSVEGLEQRSSIPPQALHKNCSSSATGEVKPSRHILHAPVPCHPQPIKSSPGSLPWPLSESSDWVSVATAGTSPASPRLNLPRFPNLIPTNQQVSPRRQVIGSLWPKQSMPQPPIKEPTVVFRVSGLPEYTESPTKPPEKKECLPARAEKAPGEGCRDTCDGPLDLSDRGKSKSSTAIKDDFPIVLHGGTRVQKSSDMNVNTNSSAQIPVSSLSPVIFPSSSCTPSGKQEQKHTSDHKHKEQEPKEEVNGKTDQSNEKKVPVLTISLRPVVVLETLNSALQKQENLSNGKLSPADEARSSTDDQDEENSSGQESKQACKRKRVSVETETDKDSDTGNIHQERKMKITMRTEDKSPC